MSSIRRNQGRRPSRGAWVMVLVATMSAGMWLAFAAPAGAAWEAPVEIAGSSQSVEGGGSAAAALGIYEGNIAIAYRQTEQKVLVTHRDKAPALTALRKRWRKRAVRQAELADHRGGRGREGNGGWAFETPRHRKKRCGAQPAQRKRARSLPGLQPARPTRALRRKLADGPAALGRQRRGDGGAHIRRTGRIQRIQLLPPVWRLRVDVGHTRYDSVDGNIGLFEAGESNAPDVAVNAAGDAIAAWTGWPELPREVAVGYRDHEGSGWTVLGGGGARIYCCSYMGPGDYRLAIDAAGNGYVIVGGGTNENKGVVFEYASRAHALGGGGWGPEQHLDRGEPGEPQEPREPRIAVDSAGDATAMWIAQDPESHHDALFAAYRPAGAATSFGSAVEVTVLRARGRSPAMSSTRLRPATR